MRIMLPVLFGLLVLAGCTTLYIGNPLPGAAMQALDKADEAVVYKLDPDSPSPAGASELNGFTVHDKTMLAGDSARAAGYTVENALDDGAVQAKTSCVFKPHDAVRVRWDSHTYDFILDYDCNLAEVFEDHRDIAWHGIVGSPGDLDVIVSDAKAHPPATGK